MKTRFFTLIFAFISLTANVFSSNVFNYDGKTISAIDINIDPVTPDQAASEKEKIRQSMQTKVGSTFDQKEFDQDLKNLYETGEYAEVNPDIATRQGTLHITISLKLNPHIAKVIIKGNKKLSSKKLRRELELRKGEPFKRETVNEAVNKLSDYLVKKGYYSSHVDYTVESGTEPGTVIVFVNVYEGPLAHIQKIVFEGFTPAEETELRKMIQSKKYNFLSFLTGSGIYKDEQIEADTQTIVKYMQNQGYADAKVQIQVKKEDKGLYLSITCEKGDLYHINKINFTGNTIFDDATLEKALPIKHGDIFSPDALRQASEAIREYYTKRAYIDTTVQFRLHSSLLTKEYDVTFEVQESAKFKVGMIIIRGNSVTKKSTILHNITLVPGEEFDSSKLQSTQMRLMSLGYFKSVSVYAVKATGNQNVDKEAYRNVIIEVEETQTGNVSAFVGASTTQQIFGGLDIIENNFNIEGLTNWSKGFSGLRGGGQFAKLRVQIGENEKVYSVSWLNPHLADTPWQFGFDLSYANSHVQSPDYAIHNFNGNANAGYPLTRYLRAISKFRTKLTALKKTSSGVVIPPEQFANDGLITGLGAGLLYDSRNTSIRTRSGIYSAFEGEFAAMTKKNASTAENSTFPFLKFNFNNALYYPLWSLGTLKGRGEVKFLQALMENTSENIPIGEKFFLGGEGTVRGYKPASIGPQFYATKNEGQNPTGGVSSFLVSVEYIQNIFKSFDTFVFFDGGSISADLYSIGRFKMSYGAGVSFDIGRGAPFIVGYGIPINPDNKDQVENFFFSFGGAF
ncbi:MAG: outer membrane protein assembly factor BamA [Chlamydiae bacterium]|nr:outer membrane protein assembly factor BamA [Chlamydiota bacterium]